MRAPSRIVMLPDAAPPIAEAVSKIFQHLLKAYPLVPPPILRIKAAAHDSMYDTREDIIYICVPDGMQIAQLWPLSPQPDQWTGMQIEVLEEFAHAIQQRLKTDAASQEAIQLNESYGHWFEDQGHGPLFFEAIVRLSGSLSIGCTELAINLSGYSLASLKRNQ